MCVCVIYVVYAQYTLGLSFWKLKVWLKTKVFTRIYDVLWLGRDGECSRRVPLPGAPIVPRNPPGYNLMSSTLLVVHVWKRSASADCWCISTRCARLTLYSCRTDCQMEGAHSNVLLFLTDSIRKFVDKSTIKFARGVKLETKNGKSEDRILVSSWNTFYSWIAVIKGRAFSCSI